MILTDNLDISNTFPVPKLRIMIFTNDSEGRCQPQAHTEVSFGEARSIAQFILRVLDEIETWEDWDEPLADAPLKEVKV